MRTVPEVDDGSNRRVTVADNNTALEREVLGLKEMHQYEVASRLRSCVQVESSLKRVQETNFKIAVIFEL